MPLFATLFGSLATALASLFSLFFGYKTALKLAAYTAWIGILSALLVSVFVCVSALMSGVYAAAAGLSLGWVARFLMGLGMFIPSNAVTVMSCVASVWIATSIYRVQKDGIFGFAS